MLVWEDKTQDMKRSAWLKSMYIQGTSPESLPLRGREGEARKFPARLPMTPARSRMQKGDLDLGDGGFGKKQCVYVNRNGGGW